MRTEGRAGGFQLISKTNSSYRSVAMGVYATGISLAISLAAAPAKADAGADGLAKAKSIVAQATASVKDLHISSSSPAIAKDKLIVTIPCAYAAEGCKAVVDGVGEAAKQLGWQTKMIDPAGNPDKARQAIRTAILLKANGIVLAAPVASALKADIAAARAAGIKVIETMEPPTDGFADAAVSNDRIEAGTWAAAFLTVQTEAKGKIIVVHDPEFLSTSDEVTGFNKGITELCPSCVIQRQVNFQIANLQIQLPQQYQAALRANQDADATFVVYDPIYNAIAPMIRLSSSASKMQVIGVNGDDDAIKNVKNDNTPFKATIAFPLQWMSYAAVDQLNRLFSGEQLPSELVRYKVPNKLIVSSNVTTIPWDGDVDWKAAYTAAWKAAK